MVNPMKDIIVATGLGVVAGIAWKQFKNSEMNRIDAFYKWYDQQQATKKVTHDDD